MKALITGIAGQDGTYLAEYLWEKDYEVHGIIRSYESQDFIRHEHLLKNAKLHNLDLTNADDVKDLISMHRFDEIYNLASQSSPSISFEQPLETFDVNTNSPLFLLEAIRHFSPETRFYQASSSELFGGIPEYAPQDEQTGFHPRSPYGVSKLAAYWLVVNYREAYGLNCCSGILFNHESPRRRGDFVTKKICEWIKQYAVGENDGPLVLGNINAKRDWGHSRDFVRAMWMMLNPDKLESPFCQDEPVFKEFVVGTGISYSIKNFIEIALKKYGKSITWKAAGSLHNKHGRKDTQIELEEGISENGDVIVTVSKEFWRPAEVIEVRANPGKIKEELGWESLVSLDQLIDELLFR